MKIRQLLESVQFAPALEEYPVESKLTDMISISSYVGNQLFKNAKEYPFFYKYLVDRNMNYDAAIRVDMDGTDDYDKPQGTVNIYLKNLPDRFASNLKSSLHKTVEHLRQYFDVGKLQYEGSRPEYTDYSNKPPRKKFEKGMSLEQLAVIRIPLLKNKASEYTPPPSLNVANGNVRIVANLLGVDAGDENMGVLKLKDIPRAMMRLRNLSDDKLNSFTRDDTIDRGGTKVVKNSDGSSSISRSGPTIYNIGVDRHHVNRYAKELLQILQYCLDNKVHLSWA